MVLTLAETTSLGAWMWRNWALLAMVGTCASLLGFVVWLLAKYTRLCLNIFRDSPPPLSIPPMDHPLLKGEIVRFRSFDGTSLRGMHLAARTPGESLGTIIFCHEYGSNMFSVARYARWLLDAGFDLFTFDFRGHGESSIHRKYHPLQWPSDKDMQDVLGACAHVHSTLAEQGRPTDIGLFGISRGAGSALLAAASDPSVRAIVCDGAFSTDTTLVAFMKRWAHIFARIRLVYENHPEGFWHGLLWLMMRFAQPGQGCRYPSVRKALADMEARPILLIHGQRDRYIAVDQSRLLYDLAPSPKYLWVCPNAKHNQSVTIAPREYAARTVAFFRKHLAGLDVPETEITAPPAGAGEFHVA
jgi:alpha-beta hydrolase superfamily lysophospholipase